MKKPMYVRMMEAYCRRCRADTASGGENFDRLYDSFLSERNIGDGRRRHYEVLRRMIHRYESYIRYSRGAGNYSFNVSEADCRFLENFYDYVENEHLYIIRYPSILSEHPEPHGIGPRGKNYMNAVFKELRAFFN